MRIEKNVWLSEYTSFRMGGKAGILYIPESREELIEVLISNPSLYTYKIGGGSNLLINDSVMFPQVLCLRECCKELQEREDGCLYVGASIRLQSLIRKMQEKELGGIEYLFSVPGLVGGAICMNAGRGSKFNQSISDFIKTVTVLVDGRIVEYSREECAFAYRRSIFQNMEKCVILGALFQFPEVPKEESEKRIRERLERCKKLQDMSEPNFGTVFCESDPKVLGLVRKLHPGKKTGCRFSAKTGNWMLHGRNGTFEEALKLIQITEIWHKRLKKDCRTEVKIWKQ